MVFRVKKEALKYLWHFFLVLFVIFAMASLIHYGSGDVIKAIYTLLLSGICLKMVDWFSFSEKI